MTDKTTSPSRELRDILESNEGIATLQKVVPSGYPLDAMKEQIIAYYKAGGDEGRLRECSPQSIARAFFRSVALGLDCVNKELSEAYLVPYKGIATLQIGYRGYAKLARRSAVVKRVIAEVVLESEMEGFEILPFDGRINHRIDPRAQRTNEKNYVGAYAAIWLEDEDAPVIRWMDKQEIVERRARAKTRKFWDSDPYPMWRKCPLKALLMGGSVPLSQEAEQAIRDDEDEEIKSAEVVEVQDGEDEVVKQIAAEVRPDEQTIDLDALEAALAESEAVPAPKAEKPAKRKGGRPKGSKNKPKPKPTPEPEPEKPAEEDPDPFGMGWGQPSEEDQFEEAKSALLACTDLDALLEKANEIREDPTLQAYLMDLREVYEQARKKLA